MVLLLALPVFAAVALTHRYLKLYAPSNLLVRHVQSQPARLRTAAALAMLAAVLLAAMHGVVMALVAGAPGWLNFVVLAVAWDAIKLGWLTIAVVVRSLGVITWRLTGQLSRHS